MNGAAETPADLPLRAVASVPVEWLVLDRRNPRLVGGDGADRVDAIIARLYRRESLDELLQSIAANGYLDIEPLIVLRDDERLIVLEGNRRLAAVCLFREPNWVNLISKRFGILINVPKISNRHRATLDRISVYRVAMREDARAFVGFKHINGAAKWDSYAKARFAAEWYRAGGVSLDDIASRIGDKHDTVKRMVNAIYVLDQAKNTGKFDIDDRMSRRLNFSHFYTALARGSYMEFLGLGPSWSDFALVDNPIPENRLEHLRKVLRWLYGSRSEDIRPVVVSQNPHVKQLGEVLASQEGLTVLEDTGSLSDAYASTGTAEQRFREALLRARREVRTAMGNLRGFDGQGESLVDIAENEKHRREGRVIFMPYLPPDEFRSGEQPNLDLTADYLELKAVLSRDGQSLSQDIVGALDLSSDGDFDDSGIGELAKDIAAGAVVRMISRLKILREAYPFRIDDSGDAVVLNAGELNRGQIAYLICLMLSNVRAVSPLLNDSIHHPSDAQVLDLRRHFQCIATAAVAAEIGGPAWSFGFPRSDGSGFIPKLSEIWASLKDGAVGADPSAPTMPKDDGVDVFAWREQRDGLPGFLLAAAQVSTGKDWREKSIKSHVADVFPRRWFTRPPATEMVIYHVVPFAIPDDRFRDNVLTLGNILHRLRVPLRVMEAARLVDNGVKVEDFERLTEAREWMASYMTRVRGS